MFPDIDHHLRSKTLHQINTDHPHVQHLNQMVALFSQLGLESRFKNKRTKKQIFKHIGYLIYRKRIFVTTSIAVNTKNAQVGIDLTNILNEYQVIIN